MKSVLISIQPKWCELIASGKKMVEVRKTKPKLEKPFKVYIYCTKDFSMGTFYQKPLDLENAEVLQGKVIGEFVCEKIQVDRPKSLYASHKTVVNSCVSIQQLIDYAGKRETLSFWHISNLVIYEKPKELNEFYTIKKCNACKSGYESTACVYDEDCKVPSPITRPPQSWCYVESEVQGE